MGGFFSPLDITRCAYARMAMAAWSSDTLLYQAIKHCLTNETIHLIMLPVSPVSALAP